ncbi:MAG: alpha/beta fold hydrolase [Myxococcota bacterium]
MTAELYVRELGEGRPVLLVGGCPTPASYMQPLAERLATSYRVLLPDLPGYGRSPAVVDPGDLDAAQRALEDLILDRGFEEAAVVGFSFGAWRALRMARDARVRSTAVVSLAGTACFTEEEREGLLGFADAVQAGADLRDVAPARFLSPEHAARHPEHAEAVKDWLGATTPGVLVAELRAAAASEDLLPALGRLTSPVVARAGELDQAAQPAHSEQIANAAPRGELQIVPGVGHALLYEDFDATAAAVREALDGGDWAA